VNSSILSSCQSQTIELIPGFLRACRLNPDKAAFMLDGQITSYAQLLQLVDAAALKIETCLTGSGYKALQHRLHIAIATKNCVEVAVWYLFAAREGHVLCLLDPDWPRQTMAYALDLYQPHG